MKFSENFPKKFSKNFLKFSKIVECIPLKNDLSIDKTIISK